MEPTNLNHTSGASGSDDVLDTLLRRHTPPPLADDGFSTRMLAALPPAANQPTPLRALLIIFAGLAGAATTAAGIDAFGGLVVISDTLADRLQTFAPAPSSSPIGSGSVFAIAAGVAAASLLYALRPRFFRRALAFFGR